MEFIGKKILYNTIIGNTDWTFVKCIPNLYVILYIKRLKYNNLWNWNVLIQLDSRALHSSQQ